MTSPNDQIGEINFPLRFTALLVIAVICVTIWYGVVVSWDLEKVLIFGGAGTATSGTILAAFYMGRALNLAISQASGEIEAERRLIDMHRRERSAKFGERWNDPNMYHAREVCRSILDHDQLGNDLIEFVEDKKTNVIHILNFLEEVAISIEHGLVDATLARNQFEGIVIGLWQTLDPWIAQHRITRNRPQIFSKLEGLYNTWR